MVNIMAVADQATIPLKSICWFLPKLLALMPAAAGISSPTNVDFHKCRHIQMSPHLSGYIHPQFHNSLVKIVSMTIKNLQILRITGKTYHWSYIRVYRTRHCAVHVKWKNHHSVDQNVSVSSVLSHPHGNNGVSKVLGILLSDFVSRGPESSLWRHHGHENKQWKSAQCQLKVNAVSRSLIFKVWHSAGISGNCHNIGSTLVGLPPGGARGQGISRFASA